MNIGERIGDYEIVEVLGQGGMGQVYKVKNILSERIEAMKVLLPNTETDSDLAERFLREIKVQAAFDHPNIAKLHTALRASNQLLMVMEFVEGTSLEKLLSKGPLLVGDAVNYASQVLDALAYAHGRGVVHRDIKPANMMRTSDGKIKLLDFGIAHMANSNLTQAGTTVGSLFYMSPEQVKGGPADPRSDLYSLGIVLYEMVTGKRPFVGDSASAIMTAHLQQTPVAPNDMVPWVLGPLNEIILMAVAKDPAARFQSAAAFQNALKNVSTKETDQAKTQAMAAKTTPLPAVQPPPAATATPANQFPAQASVVQPGAPQPQAFQPSQPRIAAAPMPAVQGGTTQPAMVSSPPLSAPPAGDPAALPDFAGPSRPPEPSSRRGLYMALGSIVTLAVIVAAAIEGPKFLRTHAGGPPKATVQETAPPVAQPTPVPPAPQTTPAAETVAPQPTPQSTQPVESATSNVPAPVQPPPSPGPTTPNRRLASAAQGTAPQNHVQTTTAASSPEQPSQPNMQRLTEVRREYNSMAISVNSAKESLASIKQQMATQGLGLRSDIREAETRMTYLLNEAKDKLKSGDAEGAKHDLEMAQLALNQVEKFLGH
ncbi:MAG TPA: protein kinase [Candidatus Angelobacter sp.]|jgi:serine/threonine-protein kinase|nr:protein kinase [Candidatus Angelobacter sp.]